ncbi:MAG: gamma-glutamyl-gamma-aminobutyrate hydrolase family protein [Lachnospiraceae bacterium]|jgi:putative glutamine amidotransferase|nr:gamma-glutamyl-gamma-aminobutyrate hydrolase family protein [Lachnospiraceae bacterium]
MKKIWIAGLPEETLCYQNALRHLGLEWTAALALPDGLPERAGEPLYREIGADLARSATEGYEGLILPGGDDVDPALFGEAVNGSRGIDRALDLAQLTICGLFVKAGKPVLGICKGCQVLNVFFGGSVIQDLPSHDRHQYDNVRKQGMAHGSAIDPGNFLYDIYGPELLINSYHHQACGRLGAGLHAVQYSDDLVIEAILHERLPVIGLQWHPEKISFEERDRSLHGGLAGDPAALAEIADGARVFEYFSKM